MKRKTTASIVLSIGLILSACNMPNAAGQDSPAMSTAAAQTVQAVLSVPAPSGTLSITSTPQASATPACEELAQIVSWTRDGDTYDKAETEKNLAPDSAFTMSWVLKNNGTCVWDDTYKMVFDNGTSLTTVSSLPVMPNGHTVRNGETLTITITMKAPSSAGRYDSAYSLVNSEFRDVLSVGLITNVGAASSGSLSAPSELRYTYDCTSGSVQIGLTWVDNSSDEDGFRIYRDSKKIGETGAGITSFQDIAPTIGKFKYTVAAFNGSGESPASMNVETKNCE